MAAAKPLYMGPRLKRLRRELGLTQQAMAEELDISPSYVALIERNQRPVTADLLLRIARSYRVDVTTLAGDDGVDHARRVAELLRDPLFADIDLPRLEIDDLAASFPGISEALLRLYGAWQREAAALADRPEDEHDDPVAEVRRFMSARRNHFAGLDVRAEALAAAIAEDGPESGPRNGNASAWLARRHAIRTRALPPEVMMGQVRRFDRHNQQLLLDDTLPGPTRAFQVALQVAYSECRSDIAAMVREAQLSGPAAATLLRRALADYVAAAILMPYERFARAAEERAYDVEALAGLFGMSFEQVAHRLTTLQRPSAEGVPFFFLRVDAAGNVSKRLDGAGFPVAAHGGGCPLWSVHRAVGRSEVMTQWLELPDGQRFFSIARGVASRQARVDRAVALVCAAEHAPRLVYARGADPRRVEATPIGVSCRLCHRPECAARALPPIGREIIADDYRRGRVPYSLAGD